MLEERQGDPYVLDRRELDLFQADIEKARAFCTPPNSHSDENPV
jgi:hypothetical protein